MGKTGGMGRFVVVNSPDGLAALDDVAVGPALLAAAAAAAAAAGSGHHPADELLRLTRPAPTLSFSRLDTHAPGFALAAARAVEHGFTPVVRGRGGRATAYHEGCVVLDHLGVDPDARVRITTRFERASAVLLEALDLLGVNATVGALPGEYCPGEYSISAATTIDPARRVKLVGSAQRVVRSAWLTSMVVVVERAEPLRDVLIAVNDALGLDWDPATVGSLADVVPAGSASPTPDEVRSTLIDAYAVQSGPIDNGAWTPALHAAARSLADRYCLPAELP